METTFDFEELQLPEFGEGALFSGQALLTDDEGGWYEFTVSEIRVGEQYLQPYTDGSTFSQHLFKAIAAVLYDDRPVRKDGKYVSTLGVQAAYEWADFISQARAA